MGLSESQIDKARQMGLTEEEIDAADADMEQAAKDYNGDKEDKRLALIDVLKDCDRCPLSVEELLDCSLSELQRLHGRYVR